MSVAIKQETNGRVDIQIFPSSQLGSDTDTLSQLRSGRRGILHTVGADSGDAGPGRVDQRHRLCLPGLPRGLEGHGRRSRRIYPRPDHQGQSRGDGQDLGQRVPANHVIDQADQHAGGLQGLQDQVPVSPLWTSMFKAFDASPASINFNEVYSALQTKIVEGQEKSASADRDREALRGSEVLLDDQPHVGRLLVPRQPPRMGAAARRCAHHRCEERQRCGDEGARGTPRNSTRTCRPN